MILLFKLISITVIWVLGLKIVSSEGMLLENFGKYAESKENKIWEPIINCVWCMPSIHSLIGYVFAVGVGFITEFSWHLIFMYPLVVMASSFLCGIFWSISGMIDVASLYFKNAGENEYLEVKDRKAQFNKKNNK